MKAILKKKRKYTNTHKNKAKGYQKTPLRANCIRNPQIACGIRKLHATPTMLAISFKILFTIRYSRKSIQPYNRQTNPNWIRIQSGRWIRIKEGKMTHKSRRKLRNFMFLSAGCSLLRAKSFFCNLDALESKQIFFAIIFSVFGH